MPSAEALSLSVATLNCNECGELYSADDLLLLGATAICGRCKPVFIQRFLESGLSGTRRLDYGGFWIRGAARLIDAVLLWIVMAFLTAIFMGRSPILTGAPQQQNAWALLRLEGFVFFLQFVFAATYEIVLTAMLGGTLGKHALSLRVVTAEGLPVGWAQSAARYGAQAITGFTFGVGYIMAAFDEQKRALHDHICGTRVIRK